MRNTFPATSESPSPIERLYFANAVRTSFVLSPAARPWGNLITVRLLLYQRGLLQRSSSPQALTARRVPSARRPCRAIALSIPWGTENSSHGQSQHEEG